jgi:hypothetical protein
VLPSRNMASRKSRNAHLSIVLIGWRGYTERGLSEVRACGEAVAVRYLTEGTPRLQRFAEITASLAKLEPLDP